MSHPEFPVTDNLIYLNHAAVAPWPKRTATAVSKFANENMSYGSANYLLWLKQEQLLKKQLRQLLNAPSTDDIALVKNTSEALSFVAYGLTWSKDDNIVSSNEEFPSNRLPWQSLANQGVEFREADLNANTSPENALFELVDDNTRMITISSIQFASGRRVDLKKIGKFCDQHNILFCIDAIQSLGAVEFDVQAYHADFVMADGHKWMFGPEGLGVFYTHPDARSKLKLTQYGWHMMENTHNYENKPWKIHPSSQRFECGSPNMLAIHAWSASLSLLLETGMQQVERAVLDHANYLANRLESLPNIQLLNANTGSLNSGIVVFKHTNIENAELYKHLQAHHVICALRGGGIRFSPHFYHQKSELDQAIQIIQSV